ncbi:hypothetical protein VDG1235_4016 [Verrucomicrobiia bacterium DG1235]|nr:hypothetical protein VDG1235_4016 [Verrucomicrobiae bacterium DG1235]
MTKEEFNTRFEDALRELRPEFRKAAIIYVVVIFAFSGLALFLLKNGYIEGFTGAAVMAVSVSVPLIWIFKKFKEWKPTYRKNGLSCSECGTVFDITNKSLILTKKICPKCKAIVITD